MDGREMARKVKNSGRVGGEITEQLRLGCQAIRNPGEKTGHGQ